MEVVASLSQGRTAAAHCGLFTYKSVPVIFEPPCICGKNLKEGGQFEYLAIHGVTLKRILVNGWTLNGIVIEQRPMMGPC